MLHQDVFCRCSVELKGGFRFWMCGWVDLRREKMFSKRKLMIRWELLYSSQYTTMHIILVFDRTQHPKTKPNRTYRTSVSPLFDRTIEPNRTSPNLYISVPYIIGSSAWFGKTLLAEPPNRTLPNWILPNRTSPNLYISVPYIYSKFGLVRWNSYLAEPPYQTEL